MSPFALRRATQPTSHAIQRRVNTQSAQSGRASSPVAEEVSRPAVFIVSPSLPHTGDEPEYRTLRDILQRGDHAEAARFYKQHSDIQLAPLVAGCSTQQLVNLLPLLNLNRHHSGFDRQTHAHVQCQVLHHLLNQVLDLPQVVNPARGVSRTNELHRAMVFDVMTDFISKNPDLDVEKFLRGCQTFDSSPAAKAWETDKKEAILVYMRQDHPLYEALKYQDLGHKVDDEVVDHMRTFFIENPQSKQAILETFSVRASAEQLETVLPHIPEENKYRKDVQEKVAIHVIYEREPDEVVSFLAEEKDKGLNMEMVWRVAINAGREDLAEDLEQGGFIPPSDAMAQLRDRAQLLGHQRIFDALEFLIADQENSDSMDVDASGSDSDVSSR